jgi:hypothetical protein
LETLLKSDRLIWLQTIEDSPQNGKTNKVFYFVSLIMDRLGKYEAIQWAFIEFIKSGYLWNGILVVFDDKLKEKVSECYKWQM